MVRKFASFLDLQSEMIGCLITSIRGTNAILLEAFSYQFVVNCYLQGWAVWCAGPHYVIFLFLCLNLAFPDQDIINVKHYFIY